MTTYKVCGVLAGAYRGGRTNLKATLTHYEVPGTADALCGRVQPGGLCDVALEGPPTCQHCVRDAAKGGGQATDTAVTIGPVPELPPDPPEPRQRLGDAGGHVFVTRAAAERYAAFSGQMLESARRDLTVLLLDAKLQTDGSPSHWRARSRATGLDISATVSREGPLLVVLSCSVREAR